MSDKTNSFASSDSTRLMHGVGYQANLEKRRIKNATKSFVFWNIVFACVLGVDYSMGLALFEYIAPEIGGSRLSAAILALIFPIAVVAMHLRIDDKNGERTENRLRLLVGIGIFVFLFGASMQIAAIMFDGAEGIGSSFISGTGIITGDIPGQSQQKPSPLTSIPPIMFFFSMGFGLILTFYVSHRILLRLEDQHRIFSNASDRPYEIKELVGGFDALRKDYDKAAAFRQGLIKKLPRDPETSFAQIVSAGVHKELLAHKKSLRYFPKASSQQDVVTGELARKSEFPNHIETREAGMQRISEIKDAMRPIAVLAALDAIPPKDEE